MAFTGKESLLLQNQKLDQFVRQSDQYYQTFLSIVKENSNLQDEITSLQIDKGRLADMNGKLENDLLKLHGLIESLQQQIGSLISAEDEIRELKKIVAERDVKIPIIEKELLDTKERHEDTVKTLQLEHSKKITDMAHSLTEERNEAVSELKQRVEEERNHNIQLQETLKNNELKKQNDIVCLKMEFETKMKLLQRQKNQSALSKQSCDQEIFRKKLNHMKEEYEKKISELEERVSSLQWTLSEAPTLPLRERLHLFSNTNTAAITSTTSTTTNPLFNNNNNNYNKLKKKKLC